MKIILTKDVKGVGRKNKVMEVSDGYGRNYLIRQGLARLADAGSLKALSEKRLADERLADAKRVELEGYAKKLNSFDISIERIANEKGVMFESVDVKHVLPYLHKAGFRLVGEGDISGMPIKRTGEHKITVDLGDKKAQVTIRINEKK